MILHKWYLNTNYLTSHQGHRHITASVKPFLLLYYLRQILALSLYSHHSPSLFRSLETSLRIKGTDEKNYEDERNVDWINN